MSSEYNQHTPPTPEPFWSRGGCGPTVILCAGIIVLVLIILVLVNPPHF